MDHRTTEDIARDLAERLEDKKRRRITLSTYRQAFERAVGHPCNFFTDDKVIEIAFWVEYLRRGESQ